MKSWLARERRDGEILEVEFLASLRQGGEAGTHFGYDIQHHYPDDRKMIDLGKAPPRSATTAIIDGELTKTLPAPSP